jgi:hypothetical protein
MVQLARNLTDAEEPFFRHTRFLIMDRDTNAVRRRSGRMLPSSIFVKPCGSMM